MLWAIWTERKDMSNQEYSGAKNRVYTLYRVSTLGQVEKDDIPMQKTKCRAFAEEKGWMIIKEFAEKGVSGYKVAAKDRDAIQEIQKAAVAGKFDILLVFMFDRLGRRDDETPFVVEWFVKCGIEVWSCMEGQQRFDSHVDKLMNYIRYWQASGESLKTSMRVKTRLSQLTNEGYYTGGTYPFGYRIEKQGRLNKKGQGVYDLLIDENEAEIVRLIFRKYVDEGYGAQRLCRWLHDQGITNRGGKGFPNTTINRIIKNRLYIGILKNGETEIKLDHLQIIEDGLFSRAQTIMTSRVCEHKSIPMNNKGKTLLVGKLYCAHCGNRLTITTSGHKQKDETGNDGYVTRLRYQCHYQVRHPGECNGQSVYVAKRVDSIVDEILRLKFSEIKATSKAEVLKKQSDRDCKAAKQKLEWAEKKLRQREQDQRDFQIQVLKVIRGESKLSMDFLTSAIEQTEREIEKAKIAVEEAGQELTDMEELAEQRKAELDEIITWADIYENSTLERKKMIVAQLIKKVTVGRGYQMSVEFNITFDELQRAITGEYAEEAGICTAFLPELKLQNSA